MASNIGPTSSCSLPPLPRVCSSSSLCALTVQPAAQKRGPRHSALALNLKDCDYPETLPEFDLTIGPCAVPSKKLQGSRPVGPSGTRMSFVALFFIQNDFEAAGSELSNLPIIASASAVFIHLCVSRSDCGGHGKFCRHCSPWLPRCLHYFCQLLSSSPL